MIESRVTKIESELEALVKANLIEEVAQLKSDVEEFESGCRVGNNSLKLDIKQINEQIKFEQKDKNRLKSDTQC